jgi:hypothetical protein
MTQAKKTTGSTDTPDRCARTHTDARLETCCHATPPGAVTAQGAELIEAVIAKVEAEGLETLGTCGLPPHPQPQPVPPEVLARLTFPDGKPLSPALKRWLAYDASWLGWFDDPADPVFKPQKLGAYCEAEFGMDWGYGELEAVLGGDCYPLHFGCDSRRFLYVGDRDSSGEYPVLLLDTDDTRYIGVEYPGIDVYLADNAGLIDLLHGTYGHAITSVTYGPRMQEHADRYFGGQVGVEMVEHTVENGKLVVTPFDSGDDE